jgi:hypothetical protein
MRELIPITGKYVPKSFLSLDSALLSTCFNFKSRKAIMSTVSDNLHEKCDTCFGVCNAAGENHQYTLISLLQSGLSKAFQRPSALMFLCFPAFAATCRQAFCTIQAPRFFKRIGHN